MPPPPKGKAPTKGAKQILMENVSTISFYRMMALGASAAYGVVSLGFYWDSFTGGIIFLNIFIMSIYIGCYQMMRYISRPTYTENNQLIDPGLDLNMEGGMGESHYMELSKIQISKLDSNNWVSWKYRMSALLRGMDGLMDIVQGKTRKPEKPAVSGGTGDAAAVEVLAVYSKNLGEYLKHVKDIVILASITHVLAAVSNYFWLLLLLLPARAFWLLWVNVLGPWFFQEAPQDMEQDEKKKKKMERKMKRYQQ